MRSLQGDRFLKRFAGDLHHHQKQNLLEDDEQKTDLEKTESSENCKIEGEDLQKECGSENTEPIKSGSDEALQKDPLADQRKSGEGMRSTPSNR
jgi:hypothetical protein